MRRHLPQTSEVMEDRTRTSTPSQRTPMIPGRMRHPLAVLLNLPVRIRIYLTTLVRAQVHVRAILLHVKNLS